MTRDTLWSICRGRAAFCRLLLFVAVAYFSPLSSNARAGQAIVRGKVVSGNNKPVAVVWMLDHSTRQEKQHVDTSGSENEFRFSGVAAGTYDIVICPSGSYVHKCKTVTLAYGENHFEPFEVEQARTVKIGVVVVPDPKRPNEKALPVRIGDDACEIPPRDRDTYNSSCYAGCYEFDVAAHGRYVLVWNGKRLSFSTDNLNKYADGLLITLFTDGRESPLRTASCREPDCSPVTGGSQRD